MILQMFSRNFLTNYKKLCFSRTGRNTCPLYLVHIQMFSPKFPTNREIFSFLYSAPTNGFHLRRYNTHEASVRIATLELNNNTNTGGES